ncbi:MAG: adenosylcobinamide-GDP ribazoletransferase [Litorilinea sp.]
MEARAIGALARTHARRMGLALGFLTVIPMPNLPYSPAEMGRAGVWFPWVGLLMGGALWATHAAATALFAPWLAAVAVVGCWAVLTGALHLDGLADCCDGLLPPVAQERRLEIMRDPRVGAFGVVGLVLFLAAKIGVVAELGQAGWVLLLAPVWARWLLLWLARQPAARPGGMGAAFGDALTGRIVGQAALLPVALLLLSISGLIPAWGGSAWASGWAAVGAVVAATLCMGAIIRFARARIGGVTGDVLGLGVELCELSVLLAYCAIAGLAF